MLGYIDWILAIVAILGGLYLYGTWNHDYFKKRKFPSCPSPFPFFGHMYPMAFRTQAVGDMLQQMYENTKDFKFHGFFDFMNPVILANDPEVIKMIMVKDFEYFVDRVPFVTKDTDSLFGKSLFALEGQDWRDMRSHLSPAFTSSKMKAMFVLISESGKQMADHIQKRYTVEKSQQVEVDMKDLFTRFANDVIATAAFGIKCDSLDEPNNEFYLSGKESVNFTGLQALKFMGYKVSPKGMRFLGIPFMPEKTKNFFRSLVVDTMEVREREGIIRPDLIHLLMEAKKGTLKHEGTDDVDTHRPSKKVIELDDEDFTAQAFLFFLAGFDTTSTHLCFLAHFIATYPDVQRRLQEEIDAVLEENGGKLTYDGIQGAKYLDMCMSEALRLWPPAIASNRQCVKPYVIPATDKTPAINLKVGDGVWVSVIGIHRDPQYYPDPERFDPERFSDENKHNINPFTYMPFGVGPRNCIGMRFAQLEVKIAIVHLLSRFNLEVSPKTPKKLVMMKEMNLKVEGGFWLGMTPRN